MPGSGFLGRAGNTSVEFGLVLTPLLLFIFAIIGFGQYLWYQQTLQSALDTASQYVYANTNQNIAVTEAAIPAQVQAAVPGLDPTLVSVTTSTSVVGDNTFMTIGLSYPFTFLGLWGSPTLPTTVTATGTVPVQ